MAILLKSLTTLHALLVVANLLLLLFTNTESSVFLIDPWFNIFVFGISAAFLGLVVTHLEKLKKASKKSDKPDAPKAQARLVELKDLRSKGLVNSKEYEAKRLEILKSL